MVRLRYSNFSITFFISAFNFQILLLADVIVVIMFSLRLLSVRDYDISVRDDTSV